ncbi:hypothetical protein FZEAL_9679 [Fusarium zealandicum]|uniref:Uncharacterized protein n=1 Tax=Fusarium zealandicum TaxID=1053134 RepID=A0A8H4U9L2_9HYPO|nr:hypothetical protein FZEAL_9679 [Fusarium zealandicum]
MYQKLWKPEAEGPEIVFDEAHQVMNWHLSAGSHGISKTVLEYRFDFERCIPPQDIVSPHPFDQQPPGQRFFSRSARMARVSDQSHHRQLDSTLGYLEHPKRWRFTHGCKARVLEGRLYLSRSHHITGPNMSAWSFLGIIDNLGLPVCNHLHTYTMCGENLLARSAFVNDTGSALPELRFIVMMGFPDGAHNCFSETRSCQICFTDYVVTFKASEAEDLFSFELVTYHGLGTCQTPYEREWRFLHEKVRTGIENRSERRYGVSQPGDVWKRWQQSEAQPDNQITKTSSWVSFDQML